MYWETKKFVTCFIVIFTLFPCSRIEPTVALRYNSIANKEAVVNGDMGTHHGYPPRAQHR